MDKTGQLIVAVLIVAFVIERVTATGIFFIDRKQQTAEGRRKIEVICFSVVLAGIAVWLLDLHLLRDGAHITAPSFIDPLLTTLVIVAGAEHIRDFIAAPRGAPPAAAESKAPPIKIRIEEGEGHVREVTLVP